MREAGRLKCGYYPIAASALDHVLRALELENPAASHILDPCAGEGDALFYLAERLEIPPANVWAVELDAGRGDALSRRHPGDNVLAPASFFGCDIKSNAFSVVYCNPPYDDVGQGWGRVEELFFDDALDRVVPGGLFVGVFTERVVLDRLATRLMARCTAISVEPLPADVRKYREVFVVAVKRPAIVDPRNLNWHAEHASTVRPRRYLGVPTSTGPVDCPYPQWKKVAPTDDELFAMLQRSPLRKHLQPPPAEPPLPRPPVSLSKGHVALMLASGYLNGLVEPPGEPPHVVRGSAHKVEEKVDVEEDVTKHQTKTVTTYRERIQLTVRAVDASGEIKTFCS